MGQCSLGSVIVALGELGVVSILLGDDPDKLMIELRNRFPAIDLHDGEALAETALTRIIAFFENPASGHDLPLDLRGTPFRRRVWEAVMDIPAGETSTYSAIARKIGAPNAMRAVGSACTANPMAIIVPTHRVLHKGQSLSNGLTKSSQRQRALIARETQAKDRPE